MGFRLVPKPVTLNDLERRNGRLVCALFSRIRLLWGCITQKWLKIRQYILRVKCRPKNLVSSDISIMAIFEGDHPQRGRALQSLAKILHIISPNLEMVQDKRSVTIND